MMKISFQGPYGFVKQDNLSSIFTSESATKRGIYIWTIPFHDKELVYYVGMTASQTFGKRLTQHIKGYLSGEYGINDPQALREGKRARIWDGLWRGADVDEFIKGHAELFPKIIDLLQTYRIYIAAIDRDKRFIERVEAAIASYIYAQQGLEGNFQETEIRYHGRKNNEKSQMVQLVCNNRIIGLPVHLQV